METLSMRPYKKCLRHAERMVHVLLHDSVLHILCDSQILVYRRSSAETFLLHHAIVCRRALVGKDICAEFLSKVVPEIVPCCTAGTVQALLRWLRLSLAHPN